jgi:AcrR family transcriptional regulator
MTMERAGSRVGGAQVGERLQNSGNLERQHRAMEKILAAATRAMTDNPRASLAEIAHEAGVGRTTLHRYFPTRDALVRAISARAIDRLGAVFAGVDFDQPFAAALNQLVVDCLPLGPEMVFVGNSPDAWADGEHVRYEDFTTILAAAAERAQARGEVRPNVPSWWVAELVMLNLWGAWYVVSGGYVGPRAMPALIMDTVLHGIALNAGDDPKETGQRYPLDPKPRLG